MLGCSNHLMFTYLMIYDFCILHDHSLITRTSLFMNVIMWWCIVIVTAWTPIMSLLVMWLMVLGTPEYAALLVYACYMMVFDCSCHSLSTQHLQASGSSLSFMLSSSSWLSWSWCCLSSVVSVSASDDSKSFWPKIFTVSGELSG